MVLLMLVVTGFVVVSLLLTALLQLLWNMTLPDLFGTKTIGYWQAFRLLLIVSILFGPGTFVRFNGNGSLAHSSVARASSSTVLSSATQRRHHSGALPGADLDTVYADAREIGYPRDAI